MAGDPVRAPESYLTGWPVSEPYDARFDQSNPDNPMADESKEQFGITPDGMVDQLMIDAMMPERKWTPDVQATSQGIHRLGIRENPGTKGRKSHLA